ncbi:MAG: hypothetical protein RIC12_01945 [Pirellulales bacterium]
MLATHVVCCWLQVRRFELATPPINDMNSDQFGVGSGRRGFATGRRSSCCNFQLRFTITGVASAQSLGIQAEGPGGIFAEIRFEHCEVHQPFVSRERRIATFLASSSSLRPPIQFPLSAILVFGMHSTGAGSGCVLSRGHVHAAPLFQ